jgi:hypothetical protein
MAFYQQFKTLTLIDNFDPSKIVFDKPRDEEVGGNKHIKGKRIKIGYLNDGKVSELIIPTEKLFAYKGVRPTKPFGREESDEIIGYNLPISLYSRDSNNGRDRKFVDIFRQIIDLAKDHVISVKKQIGQAHLEKVMLYKWDNMLYEKKNEEGDPANDFGPTLFAKLMYSRDKNMIVTKLVDFKGKPLQLDHVLLKPADVIASVKFESIYVNSNGCSLQVKITEALMNVKTTQAADNLLLKSFLVADDDTELDQDMDLLKPEVVKESKDQESKDQESKDQESKDQESSEHEEEEDEEQSQEEEHSHEEAEVKNDEDDIQVSEPEPDEEPEPEPKKPVKKITKKK